jgi:hypothetical protein
MSKGTNRMANNFNPATSNKELVSTSHDQFIQNRMKTANLFVKSLGVLALMLTSLVGIKAQTLIAEYPFNNTLAASTGAFGNATFGGSAATLNATDICTDNLASGSTNSLNVPSITSLNTSAFELALDVNLTTLPTGSVQGRIFYLSSTSLDKFSLLVNSTGNISVNYRIAGTNYSTAWSSLTVSSGINYAIRAQYVNNTIIVQVGSVVYVNHTTPGGAIDAASNIRQIYLGDHPQSSSNFVSACYSNLKIYNNPTPVHI